MRSLSRLLAVPLLTVGLWLPSPDANAQERQGTQQPQDPELKVDLSDDRYASIDEAEGTDHAGDEWFRKVDIWGYGAMSYLHTGSDGLAPEGTLLLREASLFIEADVWTNTSLFFEIQTDRLSNQSLDIQAGEVYAHFRNLLEFGDDGYLGLKVGRFDVPFGEDYLRQDATDNPLIGYPAAFPYGLDEGVLVYGEYAGIGLVASLTEGNSRSSAASSGGYQIGPFEDLAPAVTMRVYGNPLESLYLSGSFMYTGDSPESSLFFTGGPIVPVGTSFPSSLGSSPSQKVSSLLYGFDARYDISGRGSLTLSFGQAFIDDDVDAFDRDFLWFTVEPAYHIFDRVEAIFRWSEIGTYDSDEGYRFEGQPFAGGSEDFGYDTKRFRRISGGLRWKVTPNVILKAEVGMDRFWLIDASSFNADDNRRGFGGLEVVLSF